MVILGINGYSMWSFHDPSACLIIDGKVISFVEEERLCRIKHAVNKSPVLSVKACLKSGKIKWDEVDYLAVGWDIPSFVSYSSIKMTTNEIIDSLLKSIKAPASFSKKKVIFVPHHVSHAWSGICLAQNKQSLVLVIDGQGEKDSISVFRHKKGKCSLVSSFDASYSLGYFYEAAAWFTGLGLSGSGKLMGLASYGTYTDKLAFNINMSKAFETPIPSNFIKQRKRKKDMDHSIRIVNDFWIPHFSNLFPQLNWFDLPKKLPFDLRNNLENIENAILVASYTQLSTEKATLSLINSYLQSDDEAIILAGGVAQNCKLNGLINESFSNKDVYIQSASNDAGTALGAAVYLANELGEKNIDLSTFPYLGELYCNKDVEFYLKSTNIEYKKLNNKFKTAAKLINNDKIIGWHQGKSEIGSRALGGRSILARADSKLIRDKVNLDIKKREKWRPLAPMIKNEFGSIFFENYTESPYMLKAFYCTDKGREILQGTNHVDGSSRPQSICKNNDSIQISNLLEEVYAQSGIPAILNTSFNLAGQPIVYSPKDAIDTFINSKLDALIINDYLISR